MARSPQHPGGNRRLVGSDDGEKPAEPLLRSTELDRQLGGSDGAGSAGESHLLDSLATGVVVVDQRFLVARLNPAAEELLGISNNRAHGQPVLKLVGDDADVRDILNRVFANGETCASEMTLPATEANAHERQVDCRFSLTGKRDNPEVLLEMSDVTRRSRINRENALLVQHDAGRQMIRQLAHEIKNPLGGLRGAAQLLERQLDSDEQRQYTNVIISEADRLAALVDTLLGPTGPQQRQSANLHELIEHVLSIVTSEGIRNVVVERDYDAGLPNLSVDRDQIVQAFLNLVRNALAALDGQGRLTLRTRAEMNFTIGDTRHPVVAVIEFEDDGPGIPEAIRDSIFYPLVTGAADGTGLGLPVAQELINRHGGLIEFESRPGRTVFQVHIPIDRDHD